MSHTIIKASKIITVDPDLPVAEAVAVDDATGRIVAVGTLAECQEVDAKATVTDLGNHVLLPGFIDPHNHPFLSGLMTQAPAMWIAPYVGYPTFADVEAAFKKADEQAEPGHAVLFNGLDRMLQGAPVLNRTSLDTYFPDRPALVLDNSGHELYFNSGIAKLLGWADGKPPADPTGARYGRNEDGTSNGGLRDRRGCRSAVAGAGARRREPAGLGRAVVLPDGLARHHGIVGSCLRDGAAARLSGTGGNAGLPAARDVLPRGHRTRLRSAIARRCAVRADHQGGHQVVGRWLAVGRHHRHVLALPRHAHHPHRPDQARCHLRLDAQLHPRAVRRDAGQERCQGFAGQRPRERRCGVDLVLDAFERALSDLHLLGTDHRWRIEHLGSARGDQLHRAAQLGVAMSLGQFQFIYWGDLLDGQIFDSVHGSEWIRAGDAVKSGGRFSFHNDGLVSPPDVLLNFQTAITRRTPSGALHGPNQAISLDDAIKAQTIHAAHMLGRDKDIGSITAGKLADFVELSTDPYEVEPGELASEVKVEATWLAGRKVDPPRSAPR